MSKRITSKFTPYKHQAFGNIKEIEKGNIGERIAFHYLKSVYDHVEYCEGIKEQDKTYVFEQINGIDFKFKKSHWKNFYTVDVKCNLKDNHFPVFVDEIRKHKNDRMLHIDQNSPWAIEYDREQMIDYIDRHYPNRKRVDFVLRSKNDYLVIKNAIKNFKYIKIEKYRQFAETPIEK